MRQARDAKSFFAVFAHGELCIDRSRIENHSFELGRSNPVVCQMADIVSVPLELDHNLIVATA